MTVRYTRQNMIKGVRPVSAKILRLHEIPACFFNLLPEEKPENGRYVPGLCRTGLSKAIETVIIPVSSALRYNPVFPVRPFGENVRTYAGNRG